MKSYCCILHPWILTLLSSINESLILLKEKVVYLLPSSKVLFYEYQETFYHLCLIFFSKILVMVICLSSKIQSFICLREGLTLRCFIFFSVLLLLSLFLHPVKILQFAHAFYIMFMQRCFNKIFWQTIFAASSYTLRRKFTFTTSCN